MLSDFCMDAAMRLRILGNGSSWYPVGAAAGPASSVAGASIAVRGIRSTSRSRMRPCGPVGTAAAGSTWIRSAVARARGETPPVNTRPLSSLLSNGTASTTEDVGASGAASSFSAKSEEMSSPFSPITATVCKQGISSPGSHSTARSVPATFASSSKVALSVS